MGKVNVNQGGQNFFVRHVEKMILVVVLLLFGLLVFTGYSLESLPTDRTPDKLVASAKQAKEKVSDPENWKGIAATLVVPTGFQKRLTLQEISSTAYELDKPFEPKNMQSGQRRQDPTLFPPEKVEAMAVTGPVAYFPKRGEVDPWLDVENSVQEAPKVPKPSARNRRQMGEYPGTGSESYSEPSGSSRGMSMPPAGYGSMPGMSGSGMSGMPGMPGSGFEDPSMMVGAILADPMLRTGFRAAPPAVAKSETCVVVKALVPYKKQWDEYETKFMDALGYNPARDVPRILQFTAERADVTDDPNGPSNWEMLTFSRDQFEEWRTSGYAGIPQEVADPRYLYPFVLTMPLPPFINRDTDKLALHTDVPKMQVQLPPPMTEEQKAEEQAKLKKGKKKDSKEKKSDVPVMPGMQGMPGMPGMESGMPGMAGMPGMPGMEGSMPGMGGMPGMGMPGMMPGMGMSGTGGAEGMGSMGMGMPGSEMGMGMMSGMPGMMPGMGMPGSEGMGMSGYDGTGMMMQRGPQVPHLMIRFFDFTAEVGKKYRYRVQVLLEDPNHPMDVRWEPTERYLDDPVKKRLAPDIALEKAKKERVYFRRTEFSEPSEIVSVDVRPETHVGKIAAGRFAKASDPVASVNFILQTDEPSGKVMGVVWDAQKAVDVPGIIDGYRGTALNFKAKADVIQPINLVYKVLPDFDFVTDNIIADIRGGEELPGVDKTDPLLTIGEYAYFDERGVLHVRNELDDLENYRKLVLPEAPAAAAAMMGAGAEGTYEAEGMMPGMMPGTESPAPKRKKK